MQAPPRLVWLTIFDHPTGCWWEDIVPRSALAAAEAEGKLDEYVSECWARPPKMFVEALERLPEAEQRLWGWESEADDSHELVNVDFARAKPGEGESRPAGPATHMPPQAPRSAARAANLTGEHTFDRFKERQPNGRGDEA